VYNGWNRGESLNNPGNVLWVALYEKAYAQLAEEGWSRGPDQPNAYSAIGGGNPAVVLTQLTGHSTQEESLDSPDVADVLAQGVPAGQFAALDTPVPEPDPNVVEGHCYAVLGYDAATGMVTLYNPWGFAQQVAWSDLATDFNALDFAM
jgi:hypothetical protein